MAPKLSSRSPADDLSLHHRHLQWGGETSGPRTVVLRPHIRGDIWCSHSVVYNSKPTRKLVLLAHAIIAVLYNVHVGSVHSKTLRCVWEWDVRLWICSFNSCCIPFVCIISPGICIGSTTSTQRLCDLSSVGKFGRGEAEAELSQGG